MTIIPRKILVVRRDNIGDLVCTTPLIAVLRHALPAARIDALVNSYNAAVLARNPDLDAVHAYTKLKHRSPGQSALGPLLARLALIRRLRRERFDLAILARSGFDRHGLNFVRLLGIPRIIGFTPDGRSLRGVTDALPIPDNAKIHEVQSIWQLLSALEIEAEPGPLRMFPDPDRVVKWRKKLGAGDTATQSATLAVHISAREATRRLGEQNWISFLHAVHAVRPDVRLALFWSPGAEDDSRHPGDDAMAKRILSACDDLHLIPCPTATLDDLSAALVCCNAFIGADGGAMHMAVAVGLPTLGLFENSPFKLAHWYPWQVRHELLVSPSFAISAITPETMVAATMRLLA